VGDGGTGRPARLWTESFQVRVLGAQLLPFGSASARPWYGRVARLDTGEGLHADVAQWSERDLAKVEAPGSRPGIRSHAVVAQQVEHLLPRQDVAGSKPVSRSHALLGGSRPLRSARTGRFVCPRPERTLEGEPDRAPGSVASGCAGDTVAFESLAFLGR
jgi:hypothetical protein